MGSKQSSPVSADPDPIDLNKLIGYDDVKVGKRVLVSTPDVIDGKIHGYFPDVIGTIESVTEYEAANPFKVFYLKEDRSGKQVVIHVYKTRMPADSKVYDLSNSGGLRRTRKQKRSRRVKGGRIRLRTHRVRTLRR